MARLDAAPRYGTLIVTRDRLDRRRKIHLPVESRIISATAWPPSVQRLELTSDAKFMGLRHGGNTEGGDADLTDAQLRALSGHRTAAMTALYTKATMQQRRDGARKRLEARTKGGNLSK